MRKLASVQKILDLQPIEGADRIEVATVNGWKVVVQKGLYEIGDLCVYFEIDAVLPLEFFPELEKMKGRIKTIRLRGQLSQGYAIPISTLMEIRQIESKLFEGLDVTRLLDVEKYEPPITFKDGESVGNFPSHILPKTDEDRIQSHPDYLERMDNRSFVATVKYDGSSGTFGFIEGKFFACSRNLMKRDGDNVFWSIARLYKMEDKLRPAHQSYVVQGEVCGPGIQKNRLGLKKIEFFVFRIYNQIVKRYLTYDERTSFCREHGLQHVEMAYRGDRFDFDIDDLLDAAEGKYASGQHREGIVIEADQCVDTEFGGHLSFKVINNKFLLKGGD